MSAVSEVCTCISICKMVTEFFPPTISEEVFASNGAIWWSSTGKLLAYAEFNDTDVHKVEYSWYGSGQYPETVAIPYPKVGFLCATLKHLMIIYLPHILMIYNYLWRI